MKKILLIICTILMMCACGPDTSKGYGYNTKSEIPVTTPPDTASHRKEKKSWTPPVHVQDAHTMNFYDLDGNYRTYISAYKGEFDGHTFYLFKNSSGDIIIVKGD